MAQAHLQLLQAYDPEIEIKNCYMYGTSTANQRIEAWWAQLTRTILNKWIVYFRTLRETSQYSKDVLSDQIAIFSIFFPTIHTEVTAFVNE